MQGEHWKLDNYLVFVARFVLYVPWVWPLHVYFVSLFCLSLKLETTSSLTLKFSLAYKMERPQRESTSGPGQCCFWEFFIYEVVVVGQFLLFVFFFIVSFFPYLLFIEGIEVYFTNCRTCSNHYVKFFGLSLSNYFVPPAASLIKQQK